MLNVVAESAGHKASLSLLMTNLHFRCLHRSCKHDLGLKGIIVSFEHSNNFYVYHGQFFYEELTMICVHTVPCSLMVTAMSAVSVTI